MVTTIHTKKSVFENNEIYLKEKEKLFHNLSIRMICHELKNNDIVISAQEIAEVYRKNYDINQTIDFFDQKFDQQLDQLGEKNEVFDDDALVFLTVKVVEHDFDIHSVPDIVYIANDINDLRHHECEYQTLLKRIKKIIKRLIRRQQYHDDQDLQNMLSPYGIDFEQLLVQIFQGISQIEDGRLLEGLYASLLELTQLYHVSLRYGDMLSDLASNIARYDQSDVDEYIKTLSKHYPDDRFMLYYKILNALQMAQREDLVHHYFQEISKAIPENEEQRDLLDIIKEIFC